jgi:hypothetical protein
MYTSSDIQTQSCDRNEMATTADALTSAGVLTVGDAKAMVTTTYPKLYSRFNYAFHGHDDGAPLAEVVEAIKGDVHAWLAGMPDNFKSSNHALSRPKFGLMFVLKSERVRAQLGDEACEAAIDAVEGAWDACKRELVVAKEADSAPATEHEDELLLRSRRDDDVKLLSEALVSLLARHYDDNIATLVSNLLKR